MRKQSTYSNMYSNDITLSLSLFLDGQLPVSSLQKYTTFDEDNTFVVSCFEAILLLSQLNITIQYITAELWQPFISQYSLEHNEDLLDSEVCHNCMLQRVSITDR